MISFNEWTTIISTLQKVAEPWRLGFEPLDELGGEQHGSWVWTCVRTENGVNRYATFAVTEDAGLSSESTWLVELAASGDDSRRYAKIPVAGFRYKGFKELESHLYGDLRAKFIEAMERALKLAPEDFKLHYPTAPVR